MERMVLIPSDISQLGKDYLRDKGYTIKRGRGTDKKTIMEDIAGCDALLARTEYITRSVMEAGSRLKVISKHGAGLEKIDLEAAKDKRPSFQYGGSGGTYYAADPCLRQTSGAF